MKYLKKYESYTENSGLSEDDLYTIEQILLPYSDDKKCEFKVGNGFIYAKVVDAESSKELKETLDRWGFEYLHYEPYEHVKWWVFAFWRKEIIDDLLNYFNKVKAKKTSKDGQFILWCENNAEAMIRLKRSWLFEQDTQDKILWIRHEIWKHFTDKYSMVYSEVKELMEYVVREHLNLEGYVMMRHNANISHLVNNLLGEYR